MLLLISLEGRTCIAISWQVRETFFWGVGKRGSFISGGRILHNKFDATFKTFTPFSRVRDHAWQTQKLYPGIPKNSHRKHTQKHTQNTHIRCVFLGDSLYGCGELFNCSQAGDYFGKFFSFHGNAEKLCECEWKLQMPCTYLLNSVCTVST